MQKLIHKRSAALRKVDELIASGEYISSSIYAKQQGISVKLARSRLGTPDKIINNNGTQTFLWKAEKANPTPP